MYFQYTQWYQIASHIFYGNILSIAAKYRIYVKQLRSPSSDSYLWSDKQTKACGALNAIYQIFFLQNYEVVLVLAFY